MVSFFGSKRYTPIGVDLGSRSLKLLQLSGDYRRIVDAARWELPSSEETSPEERCQELAEGLLQLRNEREFHGREAVLCLGAEQLYVQNIRVPKVPGDGLDRLVRSEAEGKLPFPSGEAEIRYLEAGDVRQGDMSKREIVLLACHRPVLESLLSTVISAGLRPVAVDVEPAAVLRAYSKQLRRESDKQQRIMMVHLGASSSSVIISQGSDALFIKYIDISGRHLDEAVARYLKMSLADAAALRRHNGDRRADQQDPEVVRSLAEAVRPVVDRLMNEISLCIRYYSVTFRGQPLSSVVLGGGEATQGLADTLGDRLELRCELGDPLRSYDPPISIGRRGQWDVAAGLALREEN